MKRFAVFVVCVLAVLYGTDAQAVGATATDQAVIAAVNKSWATLNSTVTSMNTTLVTGENKTVTVLQGFTSNFNKLMITLLTKYTNGTFDTSMLTSIVTDMCNANIALQTQDSTLVSAVSSNAQTQVSNLMTLLVGTAQTMMATASANAGASKNNATCLTTYGGKLGVGTTSADRLTACLTAESGTLTAPAANISTIITAIQSATNVMFNMLTVCSTPVPTASPTLTGACMSQFPMLITQLSAFTTMQSTVLSALNPQYAILGWRIQRCMNLVALDINTQQLGFVTAFTNCFTTGK